MKNKLIKQNERKFLALAVLFFFILINSANNSLAQGMPLSIHGTVYDLDGATQVSAGTIITINDTTSGYFAQGITGTFYNSGRYSASIQGNSGDEVIITASNAYHSVSVVVNLQGSMRDVNLLLNTSIPSHENNAPQIISEPLTTAFIGTFYRYDVDSMDLDGDDLIYSLIEAPQRMSINPSSGVIEWLPRLRDIGRNKVIVKVEDSRNGSDTQEFEIKVRLRIRSQDLREFYLQLIENESLEGENYLISLSQFENYSVENEDLVLRSITINNNLEETHLLVRELNNKPNEIKSTFKKVYRYLQISSLNLDSELLDNVSLSFRVEKKWIKDHKYKDEEIGIARYSSGKWYYFTPEIYFEDDNFIYYSVNLNGLDDLLIYIGEFKDWTKFENLIELPYFVVGTVYERDGETQAPEEIPIKIFNKNTLEEINLQTGIGPMSGAYASIFSGNEGDKIVMTINNDEDSSYQFILKEKGKEIDFKKNILGSYKAKKSGTIKDSISSVIDLLSDLF